MIDITTQFSKYITFTFYTDGSVQAIGSTNCKSGFGWIQIHTGSPPIEFKGSTTFLPSSTKAEAMAILCAINTLPRNSITKFYTDSANCIDTFNKYLHSSNISSRRKLKINNFLIWKLIFELIDKFHLIVSLHKVNAHSNDEYNDQADALAKSGAHIPYPLIVNSKIFKDSSLGFIQWNDIYIIDRNIRKWSTSTLQARLFNSLLNNISLKTFKTLHR